MDAGDLYKASSSLRATSKRSSSFRANSSNIWRNTGIEVFSRSSREEDDEEALKWAALEKLPTFDRLRKGLLFGSKGANEVEVQNLGYEDKRNLVERLVNTVEEDNEKFLLKLRNRIDRVGIDMPTIEVRYDHLNIDAEAYSASRALPTFINFNINMIEGVLNSLHILPSRKKAFTILKDVSGIIKPCRMTLLLGPPSSGKTTLLLALAGKLDPALKVSGRVTYNGHGMEEFVPQRTAAYISQHDLHIGEMTVRETLAFSARCQGVGSRYEMLAELSRREKAANIKPDPDVDIYMKAAASEGDAANVVTDYIIKVLGLDVCADTLVGDEMIRGISGGQKKRVTTGEMIVGPAKALFMDEISTGLDSSTTYQIVNMLRQYVHIMKGTAFISLLQPAPETYDLFDDIVLLADGQIVYQGPRESVLGFFESMGFKCPERKGVADFLQEVTSRKDQQQYWARRDEPYRFISVSEFAEAFQSYVVGRRIGDELAVPFDKTKSHPAALTTTKYGLGKKELLKACTDREFLLMKRNSFVYYFKLFQASFYGGIYTGALFFSVIMVMFNGMSELAMTIYKLPVFYKQRDMYFFPAWAYAIPSWILKIPITFIEVAIWTFLTYYVIGFDPNVGRYALQITASDKFFVACSNVNEAVSAAVISSPVSISIVQIYWSSRQEHDCCKYIWLICTAPAFALGGFVLSRKDVKKWWLWGYWSSPLMYAQNAILVNEFTGHSWSKVVNGTKLGVLVMQSRGSFLKHTGIG
ncbi:UNVERIFIED_CONTAM: Pleiotropic drug resistance protein 1 [Sesamum latifolium]|uniref:Pleiotropic drug resistance protein 1 n=1 Tax=Sesamum latifolium TaxID=2727402 RepID=A0AAW2SN70_9LAMI